MTDQSATPASRELPPIRIHHFLAWTTVAAIMFALSGDPNLNLGSRTTPAAQSTMVAGRVAFTFVSSLAITIVLFGFSWRRRGLPFPVQPGQWLLVEIAGMSLLGKVTYSAVRIMRLHGDSQVSPFVLIALAWIPTLVMMIVGVGLKIYIARNKMYGQAWRRVFYWKAARRRGAAAGRSRGGGLAQPRNPR